MNNYARPESLDDLYNPRTTPNQRYSDGISAGSYAGKVERTTKADDPSYKKQSELMSWRREGWVEIIPNYYQDELPHDFKGWIPDTYKGKRPSNHIQPTIPDWQIEDRKQWHPEWKPG